MITTTADITIITMFSGFFHPYPLHPPKIEVSFRPGKLQLWYTHILFDPPPEMAFLSIMQYYLVLVLLNSLLLCIEKYPIISWMTVEQQSLYCTLTDEHPVICSLCNRRS